MVDDAIPVVDEDRRAGIEIVGELRLADKVVVTVRLRVDGGYWFDAPRCDPFVLTYAGRHVLELQLGGPVVTGNRLTTPRIRATCSSVVVRCDAMEVKQLQLNGQLGEPPELVEVGRRSLLATDLARARDNHIVDPEHGFDPGTIAPPDPRRAVAGKPRLPDADPRAGWFADPSERHELRYHDGVQWTLFVDDHGVTDADTL